jgi:hypothetical protein
MNRHVVVGMVAVAIVMMAGSVQAEPTHIDSFFDVFTELTAGPPYPSTPPVQVMVGHEKEPGMIQPDAIMGLSLQGTTGDMPARMEGRGGGGGGGGAWIDSFFDVFTDLPSGDFPVESFFDVQCAISPPEPGTDSPVLTEPPKIYHVDSFFDVFCDVEVEDGRHSLHLHGEVGPGQPLSFFDVYTGGTFDSFFDVFTEINCTGPVIDGVPLVTMTMTGTFVPEPASVMLWMLGCIGALAISRQAGK